jgi:hypothetical protein
VGTVLDNVSPYGSRRLTVEFDGTTTAAYLHDETTVIAATWIANHVRAPRTMDRSRLNAGQAPVMPAERTKHPQGRPPLLPQDLRVIWFEEGDGVALLERGNLLAVVPGWADSSRGVPGYSRDVIGRTPFAWELDEAIDVLGPRVERAAGFWSWRSSPDGWAQFQSAALGHLSSRLGPGAHYWDGAPGRRPTIGISERPPGPGRPYTVLSTVGMSAQRMPVVEQIVDDPARYARIELAVATTLPSGVAALVFLWLAGYPWRSVTWFGPGHNIRWYDKPSTFPLGGGYEGALLLEDPYGLAGPPAPDLSGFSVDGDPVRWLWILPITERSRQLAKEHGSAALVERLGAQGRSWIITPPRASLRPLKMQCRETTAAGLLITLGGWRARDHVPRAAGSATTPAPAEERT